MAYKKLKKEEDWRKASNEIIHNLRKQINPTGEFCINKQKTDYKHKE